MKAVLMNSGGVDSRVTAAMLRSQGWELHSIYNDWSGLKEQELAAKVTADSYCSSHEVFRWPSPDWVIQFELLGKRALPHAALHTTIFGATRAVSLGIEWIASGVRSEAAHDGFREGFQDLLNSSKYFPDKVLLLPLWSLGVDEITRIGLEHGVDLDTTWSCTSSPHCGSCDACRRRIKQGIALP